MRHGRGHVLGVERAGHLQRAQPGLSGGSAANAASCSSVPATTIWPAPFSLAAVRPCCVGLGDDVVAVAAEDGGHAGGGDGGGRGHRPAALADEHHRLLGGDDAGAHGGGDLADAVPGARADLGVGLGRVREEAQQRHQAGAHQQRLGHGGVADGVGVALGAVAHEVDRR